MLFFAFLSDLDSHFTVMIRNLLTDAKFCFFIAGNQFSSNLIMTIINTMKSFYLFFFWCSFFAASQITYTPTYQSKWQQQQK